MDDIDYYTTRGLCPIWTAGRIKVIDPDMIDAVSAACDANRIILHGQIVTDIRPCKRKSGPSPNTIFDSQIRLVVVGGSALTYSRREYTEDISEHRLADDAFGLILNPAEVREMIGKMKGNGNG